MPVEVKWGAALAVGLGLILAGWKVPVVLTTFHVLLCLVLIVVILLQSGSAADLAGAFGGAGSQTAFGPRSAATFLSKATTWCAIMFMLTSATLALRSAGVGSTRSSVLEKSQKPAPAPLPAKPNPPVLPPTAPKP